MERCACRTRRDTEAFMHNTVKHSHRELFTFEFVRDAFKSDQKCYGYESGTLWFSASGQWSLWPR